jgi:polyhydroxyalkanoate synthesis regulator phasin
MSLVDELIAQGMKNNAEFTQQLIEIKKRVANTQETQAIKALQDAQAGMQDVDMFSLGMSVNLDERVTNLETAVSASLNGGKQE